MAETKVSKAAGILLKNPAITNIALAKMVKAKNPQTCGWQLRQNAEKYIKRKNLRPKKKVADEKPAKSSRKPDLKSIGAKIEVQGNYVHIQIPAKSLNSLLLKKLLH